MSHVRTEFFILIPCSKPVFSPGFITIHSLGSLWAPRQHPCLFFSSTAIANLTASPTNLIYQIHLDLTCYPSSFLPPASPGATVIPHSCSCISIPAPVCSPHRRGPLLKSRSFKLFRGFLLYLEPPKFISKISNTSGGLNCDLPPASQAAPHLAPVPSFRIFKQTQIFTCLGLY